MTSSPRFYPRFAGTLPGSRIASRFVSSSISVHKKGASNRTSRPVGGSTMRGAARELWDATFFHKKQVLGVLRVFTGDGSLS